MLLIMCGWMFYGIMQYYWASCGIALRDGFFTALVAMGKCSPWVAWIGVNAVLHISWVSILTLCQSYQVIFLGMTTNERMNRGRYRHFQANGGKSPFDRGPFRNLVDFLECTCFGPQKQDWMNYFDLKSDKGIEHEPLLRPTDNYQYV
jgi:hypothetical protein